MREKKISLKDIFLENYRYHLTQGTYELKIECLPDNKQNFSAFPISYFELGIWNKFLVGRLSWPLLPDKL